MEAQTATPQGDCECGVHPSVFYLLATLLLTSCSTAMLCAAIMTEHWEHVSWERSALTALANASNTAIQWLLDEKVVKVEDTSKKKGGGGSTFLVPMNGGIWKMCVSLEEEEVSILSRAGFPTEPLCTNYLADDENEEPRADWQHLPGLFAMFTLMIIHFKRVQRVSARAVDDNADGVAGPRGPALPLLSAREFTTSWSLELGWGGVVLATTTSLLWILLSKIMRYNPLSAMLM
ncbi:uncharacterized protein LOC119832513 [Zerene cesonia]|uniref:uncharacterized protein LOC119832513 n=1 Tax=Zerene cesonia TaxID=33412 RepID=UPI0018E525A8|nr:uncharacterized protein LOC119832513 [Zerene cesonia]